jgi:hypothetical protein
MKRKKKKLNMNLHHPTADCGCNNQRQVEPAMRKTD